MESIGKLLVGVGLCLVAIGLVVWLFGDKLGWIGHLPGDLRIERPDFSFYFPIMTMALFSLGVSAILWLLGKLVR